MLEEAIATAARWGLVQAHQHVVVVERMHESFVVKVSCSRHALLLSRACSAR